jgi:hypothetical protein
MMAAALCASLGCGDNDGTGPAGPPGPEGPAGPPGSGSNGNPNASCPVGGGATSVAEGVPASAPLSSMVSLTFCDAEGTGATNIADYVKALVTRYANNQLAPWRRVPAAPRRDRQRARDPGLVPDVVVKWLDPLGWDPMTSPTVTPRFGANADYIAFLGDGWQGTPYWEGSDTSGWVWVNHEYVSNNRPRATAAPTGST